MNSSLSSLDMLGSIADGQFSDSEKETEKLAGRVKIMA